MTSIFQSRRSVSVIGQSTILLLLFCLVWPGRADEKATQQDLKKLQGTWVVIQAEHEGQPLDRIKGNKLIVKENQFRIVTQAGDLKGDLTLDPSKSPRRIDWQHQEGMLPDKKWESIYKFDGGKLFLCYAEADSGKDRPSEFATEDGSRSLLIVLERKR